MLIRLALPIHIGAGLQFDKIRVHEVRLIQQVGLPLCTLVQLPQQQQTVDRQRPEPTAVRMVQIVDDQLRQIRVVGPAETAEQVAPPIGIQIGAGQPVECRILEALEILEPSQSLFRQPLTGDRSRIQRGRQIRSLADRLSLVVELQVQLLPDVLQRPLRISGISQERLAVLDLADARRVIVPLDPVCQQLVHLLKLLGILIVQAVIIVVVLGPGDQLRQRDRPVACQREILDVSDLGSRGCRNANGQDGTDQQFPHGCHDATLPIASNLATGQLFRRKGRDWLQQKIQTN